MRVFDGCQNGRSKAQVMPGPKTCHFELRAVEARLVVEQMHDPGTRRAMMSLALRYQQLAKHAAMREASEIAEQNAPAGARSGGLKICLVCGSIGLGS